MTGKNVKGLVGRDAMRFIDLHYRDKEETMSLLKLFL